MVKRKVLWYVIGLVVILAVAAVVFRGKLGWGGASIVMPTNYNAALKQYGNRRIQFDMYCQAVPVNSTYKVGSYLMLDNRSGDARIITVNKIQYRLAGYGWKIITLESKTLPATWVLDCGSAVNVGTILIQK